MVLANLEMYVFVEPGYKDLSLSYGTRSTLSLQYFLGMQQK